MTDHHAMHPHMAGQQMAAIQMSALHDQDNSDPPAPAKDPCKIACAALCLTTGLVAPAIEPNPLLRAGLGDAYVASASDMPEGLATRPPLHPPQTFFA